mgnify:CR=1 FL=1
MSFGLHLEMTKLFSNGSFVSAGMSRIGSSIIHVFSAVVSTRSSRRPASVDRQHATSDVAGRGTGEKQRGTLDLA